MQTNNVYQHLGRIKKFDINLISIENVKFKNFINQFRCGRVGILKHKLEYLKRYLPAFFARY